MMQFVWDSKKNIINISKHGVSFFTATRAFDDPWRLLFEDREHSGREYQEKRFFCIAKVDGQVLTVRFVYRDDSIRIFGAGYWRKGKEIYEKEERE